MKRMANIGSAALAMAGAAMPANDAGDEGIENGQVFLANEARFTSRSFSEHLTNYAVNWSERESIEATLDFLFPPVRVNRRFDWKKGVNAEAFLSEADDIRAIGGDFKFVEYSQNSVESKTINKGLGIKLDWDEIGEDAEGTIQMYTGSLMNRLLRSELRRAVTTALAAANNTAKTWNGTAGEDPDMDVIKQLKVARGKSGVRPNRVLFGDGAYTARLDSLRKQNTPAGYTAANKTMAELAGWLQVDDCRVSRELYQSSASAKTDIMGNLLLMWFGLNSLTKDDPSHFKRFWTPCRGGGRVAVYRRDYDKYVTIVVEHYSRCVATDTTGVEKITVTPA